MENIFNWPYLTPIVSVIFVLLFLLQGVLILRRRKRGRREKVKPVRPTVQSALAKTHQLIVKKIGGVLAGRKEIDSRVLEELEEALITSDIGVTTSAELLAKLKDHIREAGLKDSDEIVKELEAIMLQMVGDFHSGLSIPSNQEPKVIMVVGVNGTGKTTTIAKLAAKIKKDGKEVILVAADTFRAAAQEQLKIWSERSEAQFMGAKPGSDPSALVFDAVKAAKARGFDAIIIDTAGRLHTKANLMEELKKMKRTVVKASGQEPSEIILIIDANTGQNAIAQAKQFHEAIGLTGIIVTKLDGTAKGGVVIGIVNELKMPIRYIGIGESLEDLREFVPGEFIRACFE